MKKFFSVALIAAFVLSVPAFAAVAKNASVLGFGVDSFGGGISEASLKFDLGSMDLSTGFGLSSSGGTTAFVLGGKLTMPLGKAASHMNAGGALGLYSSGGSSIIVISAVIGASTLISNDFCVGFDVYPVSISIASGSTSFSVLSGALYGHFFL